MNRIRYILSVALVAALFVAVKGTGSYEVHRHFVWGGAVRTQAVVTGVKTVRHRGTYRKLCKGARSVWQPPYTEMDVRYTYEVGGCRYEGTDCTVRLRSRPVKVGERLLIEYAADKPSLSRVAANRKFMK